eukprot:TRINITY_DN5170_c0_g1_i1.p1 TRINITY_DN5170_c0_g1~~TRINITY_DN5170_c0_g1_i1.p1  ORF type:complete len:617 (-),score=133.98 TRINITY_DN5170_c0_g1_i1:122-1900(-)
MTTNNMVEVTVFSISGATIFGPELSWECTKLSQLAETCGYQPSGECTRCGCTTGEAARHCPCSCDACHRDGCCPSVLVECQFLDGAEVLSNDMTLGSLQKSALELTMVMKQVALSEEERQSYLSEVRAAKDMLSLGGLPLVARSDPEIVLAAVRRCGEALCCASKELQADKMIVLEAVKQCGRALQYAATSLREDPDVVMVAMSSPNTQGDRLGFASESLRADKAIVMAAVSQRGSSLKHASLPLRADKEVVLAAVGHQQLPVFYPSESNDCFALDVAHPSLKSDREVVLAAVHCLGESLRFADPKFWEDKEVVLTAIAHARPNTFRLWETMHSALSADKDVLMAALAQAGNYDAGQILPIEHSSFLADKDVITAAVAKDGNLLSRAHPSLKADKDVLMAALAQATQYGASQILQIADSSLLADKDVITAAVAKDGNLLSRAHPSLKADKDVLMAALAQAAKYDASRILKIAHSSLLADKDVIMAAVAKEGNLLSRAHPSLKADREVVWHAVSDTGHFGTYSWTEHPLAHASADLQEDVDIVLQALRTSRGHAWPWVPQALRDDERVVTVARHYEDAVKRYHSHNRQSAKHV